MKLNSVIPKLNIEPQWWNDWKWQISNRLKTVSDFSLFFNLTDEEKEALTSNLTHFSFGTTPYYASLADRDDSLDPIRLMQVPSNKEFQPGAQSMCDPLGELKHSPAIRIIHRYPDRALFLATDLCGVYCRYCFRKHFTGTHQFLPSSSEYDEAISYLKSHPEIREVLISGGDPLTLSENKLEIILSDLRSLPHIEIIRLSTKMVVACPMRITKNLVTLLKKYSPIFFMVHINHPKEMTLEVGKALSLLVDEGIPVLSQTVLLRGINNHSSILQSLFRRLLFQRVKPYALYQCDPSLGSDHFRTSLQQTKEIYQQLWGKVSGLALPLFIMDIPGGGGKLPISLEFTKDDFASNNTFVGFDGVSGNYLEPIS